MLFLPCIIASNVSLKRHENCYMLKAAENLRLQIAMLESTNAIAICNSLDCLIMSHLLQQTLYCFLRFIVLGQR